MADASFEFGFYPEELSIKASTCMIETLDTDPPLAQVARDLAAHPMTAGAWHYPAITRPQAARTLDLPYSHRITVAVDDQGEAQRPADYFVWCLSLFTGMRLTTAEGGFLDAAKIRPLGDRMHENYLHTALDHADAVFRRSSDGVLPRMIAAAIHAIHLSENPRAMEHEAFGAAYMALDACYRACGDPDERDTRHGRRVERMCELVTADLGRPMPAPSWAKANKKGKSLISTIRNDAFHEALLGGEPLGYAVLDNDQLPREMAALAARLLYWLLKIPCPDYIVSNLENERAPRLITLQ